MKEHPILFSGEMARAILYGRKTQTRRVIKPQLPKRPEGFYFDAYNGGPFWNYWSPDTRMDNQVEGPARNTCHWKCPYGVPGDRLWVRETCYITDAVEDGAPLEYPPVIYAADGAIKQTGYRHVRPSIHMPRWASRITLEITNIRVERLQDISEEDAIAEGVDAISLDDMPRQATMSARADFRQLWDSINAKRGYGWDSNPWVWVIEFKRI